MSNDYYFFQSLIFLSLLISGDCFPQHAELIVQRDMGSSSDGRGGDESD